MTLALLAIGFISLLAQVVLLRELQVAFQGSELNLLLALGVWLFGTALGALAGRQPAEAPPSQPAIHRAFLAAGVLLPLALVWTRAARRTLGAVPGAFLPFPHQMLAMAIALVPVSIVFGLLFRRVAQRAASEGRPLATAYAIECAGSLAGGLAATVALRAGLSNLGTGLAAALAAAAMARPRRGFGLIVSVILLGGVVRGPALDQAMTAWNHQGLIATRDSPYGRVTITEWGGQVNVFENDALAYETGGTAAEEFVTLAALAHPAPGRILLLGGTPGLVREALLHGPAEIIHVELDSVAAALVAAHLPDELRAAQSSPRVRTVHDDPRRYMAKTARPVDLILVGMPEPTSGQSNRVYTQEFFTDCAAHLESDGILALRLPAAENLWSPPLVARMASIDRALRAVFRDVLFLPGATSIVLASPSPLGRDPEVYAARLAARQLATRLVTPAYVRFVLTNDRVDEIAAALARARVPMNRDAHPVSYRYTLALWLSKFYPAVARFEGTSLRDLRLIAGAPVVLAVLWILTRRPAARRALVVAAAGGIGIVFESLLLLAYQARSGVLYQDLGLLLMLFMAGLAVGAGVVGRWRGRGGRRRGLVLLCGLAIACAALAARLAGGFNLEIFETGAWLVVGGALSAGVFAHASRQVADQARAAGPLYAADVAGGCVGSLAGSLLLIPLVGLPATALALALLAVLAALWQ